jgi:hypothetical protein
MIDNQTPRQDDRQDGLRQDGTSERSLAETARLRASGALDSARETVSGAGQRASDGLDEAPLIALAGGLAVGALLAALLPRTDAETRALAPVGKRVSETAKAAAASAKEAGTSRLSELGLTRERGESALKSIFDGISDAAKTSSQAALSTARTKD